jgi:hypothetical protein
MRSPGDAPSGFVWSKNDRTRMSTAWPAAAASRRASAVTAATPRAHDGQEAAKVGHRHRRSALLGDP